MRKWISYLIGLTGLIALLTLASCSSVNTEPSTVKLDSVAVFWGTVSDAGTGDKLIGARVDAYCCDCAEWLDTVYTNGDGEYTIYDSGWCANHQQHDIRIIARDTEYQEAFFDYLDWVSSDNGHHDFVLIPK